MPRKAPRVFRCLLPMAATLSLGCAVWAGPTGSASSATTAPAPTVPAPSARPVAPDYGGRNGALGDTMDGGGIGAAAPDPLAQAGRAFEALVIVLAVVGGGLVLLKRSGLLKSDGLTNGKASWTSLLTARRPESNGSGSDGMTEMLAVLGSQTLPHSPGVGLHLVAVGGRLLLLGATAQSVTLLTEVAEVTSPVEQNREMPEEVAAFADYLARVGVASPSTAGTGAAQATLSAATDRLQSLLAQGRGTRD